MLKLKQGMQKTTYKQHLEIFSTKTSVYHFKLKCLIKLLSIKPYLNALSLV